MKHLKLFEKFIEESKLYHLFEKRDLETREKVTVANRIVDFLKKYNYKYSGSNVDSKIFVSFKTGDFETIIPSRALGGSQYTSPQGFYCFDMNGFKKRLFGDDSVSSDNFNPDNLSKSDNIILDLGLGYGNNGNVVGSENIWNEFNNIPRYLYLVKVKDSSLVLSSNSNALKFYSPLEKLLKLYSHNFLKENESKIFDPKDKRDNGLNKKSFIELESYFFQNKEKYNNNFIDGLQDIFRSIKQDKKNLHVRMYNFLLRCCAIISGTNKYVRFTLLCKSIGIDGFTQRKGEDSFIHPSPEFQTLLLTESCVEDLIKIDLKKELRTDQYVSKEKSKLNSNSFLKLLKSGDVLFNKKLLNFQRFNSVEDFMEIVNPKNDKKFSLKSEDYVKVDLSNNKIWKFIENIKSGDWIKISHVDESDSSKKVLKSMIIQFNNVQKTGNEITFETRGKKFRESVKVNCYINYQVGDNKVTNKNFNYNIEKQEKETPLFDPISINLPEYKYWIDNKEEMKSKGIKFEDLLDDYELKRIVNNLEELFTNREYQTEDNRVKTQNDMDLLTLFHNFKNNYINRVFSNNLNKDFVKSKMTLYYYSGGNINKPQLVMSSENLQF